LADWESKIGVLSESEDIGEIGFFGCDLQSIFSTLGRARTSSARHSLIENTLLFPLNPQIPHKWEWGKDLNII